MKTFEDLKFEKRIADETDPVMLAWMASHFGNAIQACMQFENGYGVSVVRNLLSYGGKEGLYELAVLLGEELCYDTPVTDSVEGWLTPNDVTRIMAQVQELPRATQAPDAACDD